MDADRVETLKEEIARLKVQLRAMKPGMDEARKIYHAKAAAFIKVADHHRKLDALLADNTKVKKIPKGRSGKPKEGGKVQSGKEILAGMSKESKKALLAELGIKAPKSE